jgi:hypothetical protein
MRTHLVARCTWEYPSISHNAPPTLRKVINTWADPENIREFVRVLHLWWSQSGQISRYITTKIQNEPSQTLGIRIPDSTRSRIPPFCQKISDRGVKTQVSPNPSACRNFSRQNRTGHLQELDQAMKEIKTNCYHFLEIMSSRNQSGLFGQVRPLFTIGNSEWPFIAMDD